jgi:hypothetical protein
MIESNYTLISLNDPNYESQRDKKILYNCFRLTNCEEDIYCNKKILLESQKMKGSFSITRLDLTEYNSMEEFDEMLNKLESELVYNKIRQYITESSIYINSTNPVLENNQYCIRLSGSEKDVYGNPKLVLSFKQPGGNIRNCRIDSLPEMKSIEDFNITLKNLLISYKYQPQ